MNSNKAILISAVQAALFGMTTSAIADVPALEEVVVTASKRGEQALQDIPMAIQAVGEQTLSKLSAESFNDYIKLVPGLTAVSSGGGQSQIVMRGVNATRVNHNDVQEQATVGVYIDEMPVSASGFNPDLNLFDLNRVEVLRGPQGTLYGAASMSGAIRLITNKPNVSEIEGKAEATLSTTEEGGENYSVKGLINFPVLEDKAAVRASVYRTDMDGYIDNLLGDDDYNDEEIMGGRVSLLFMPNDRLEIIASVLHQEYEAGGRPDEKSASDNADIQQFSGQVISDELQTVKFFEDGFDDDFDLYNLTLTYDFESVQLVSSTSYFDRSFSNTLDDTFRVSRVLGPILNQQFVLNQFFNDSEVRNITEELRLSSTGDGWLQWVVGAYYDDQSQEFDQDTIIPGSPIKIFVGEQDIDQTQVAVFGELTAQLTDKIEVTFGLRWFDYERDALIIADGVANGGPTLVDNESGENGFNPKYQVTYHASEDALFYASAAKGFRNGKISGFVPAFLCGAELASLGLDPTGTDVDTLWNYEVGAKTTLAEGQLTLNGAAYYIDWEDIQNRIQLQCGFSVDGNAGEITSKGIELDIGYRPSDNLSLTLGVTYTDSELTETAAFLPFADGSSAPYVPEWTVSSSAEYYFPITDGAYGFARADIRYVDSSYNEFSDDGVKFDGSRADKLDAYTIVDLTVGMDINERWMVTAFVKNAFDDEVITNIDPDRNLPADYTRARPRTIGVSVKANF